MDRAFHSLTIRTLDEGKRIIEGWATTGRTDRAGDVVESLGAEFDLPLPLLLDHDHSLAVGEVEKAEVTAQGIRFVARIKKITEAGKAKDLVDMAWHFARHGLRKCVSIGFQPIDFEPLPNGGLRFTRWSWYELSLCSVPANPDARIEAVKRAPRGSNSAVRLTSDRQPRHHVLRLTKAEMLKAKLEVEGERMMARRNRLGIPLPVVKIEAKHYVEARLAAAREKRRARDHSRTRNGAVRLRP